MQIVRLRIREVTGMAKEIFSGGEKLVALWYGNSPVNFTGA
jgi:hypothetical protein